MRPSDHGIAALRDWSRRLLFAGGVLCLGYWGWAQADAWHYQAEQNRRFDRILATAPAAEAAPGIPSSARALPAETSRRAAPGPSAGDDRGTGAGPAGSSGDRPSPAADAAATRPRAAAAPRAVARLRIPRIGLSTLVADGVDPATLRRSAGRVPGTAPPGGGGNVAVAGHRDTVFRDLKYAAPGDTVLLETPRGTLRYRVETVGVVAPDAVEVLAPTAEATLTLITCYPFSLLGPAPERYVVQARRIGGAA